MTRYGFDMTFLHRTALFLTLGLFFYSESAFCEKTLLLEKREGIVFHVKSETIRTGTCESRNDLKYDDGRQVAMVRVTISVTNTNTGKIASGVSLVTAYNAEYASWCKDFDAVNLGVSVYGGEVGPGERIESQQDYAILEGREDFTLASWTGNFSNLLDVPVKCEAGTRKVGQGRNARCEPLTAPAVQAVPSTPSTRQPAGLPPPASSSVPTAGPPSTSRTSQVGTTTSPRGRSSAFPATDGGAGARSEAPAAGRAAAVDLRERQRQEKEQRDAEARVKQQQLEAERRAAELQRKERELRAAEARATEDMQRSAELEREASEALAQGGDALSATLLSNQYRMVAQAERTGNARAAAIIRQQADRLAVQQQAIESVGQATVGIVGLLVDASERDEARRREESREARREARERREVERLREKAAAEKARAAEELRRAREELERARHAALTATLKEDDSVTFSDTPKLKDVGPPSLRMKSVGGAAPTAASPSPVLRMKEVGDTVPAAPAAAAPGLRLKAMDDGSPAPPAPSTPTLRMKDVDVSTTASPTPPASHINDVGDAMSPAPAACASCADRCMPALKECQVRKSNACKTAFLGCVCSCRRAASGCGMPMDVLEKCINKTNSSAK